jgi:hypothetical protein
MDISDDNTAEKAIFAFVRSLMSYLHEEDPETYNKTKVMMEEEAQKSYKDFEAAKDVFLNRLREIVSEDRWNKAALETNFPA